MSRRLIIVTTAIGYALVCVAISLTTEPWKGGEEGIVFAILMNAVSFPSGIIPTSLLSAMSSLASGTSLEWFFATSPFWWVFLLIGCGVAGYAQWFMILPGIAKRIRNRVLTLNGTDAHEAARRSLRR